MLTARRQRGGQDIKIFLQEQGITEVPKTASQDRRLQRTVEQAFVDRAEADQIALRKRFEGMCGPHGVNEVAKIQKIFLQEQGITEVPKTASQDWRLQRTVC